MNVGFTGTRSGLTGQQWNALRDILLQECGPSGEVHHGDCVGADDSAHHIALSLRFRIVMHPPTDRSRRAFCHAADHILPALPYLERNHAIVDATDLLVACPEGKEEKQRSGTWATVRYARKTGKPIILVFPDGTVRRENP